MLSGTGSVGNTTISGTLSPGNSPGTITMASLTLTTAASYLVQVSGTISDSVVVTGTANLAGQVVIDPLTRLTQRTTYTIVTAGALNGTFSTANFLMANNLARNPVLSYVGNDVFLTLDPGLLSPILSANATGNQKNVAGAIDNALLGGSNMSNAFSAIFNLSGNNLLNGLTQLSGETATGSQQTTFNAMTQFMGVMTDPFIEGRGAAATPSSGATPYAEEDALAYAGGRQRSGGERAAYGLMTKAPPRNVYDPALERLGGGLWRFAGHRWQFRGRIEQHHQPTVRRGGGRRLSLLAQHHCGLRAGGRRHQFQRHGWRQRALGSVPGRRVRPSHHRCGLYHQARWPMAGRTSSPIAP